MKLPSFTQIIYSAWLLAVVLSASKASDYTEQTKANAEFFCSSPEYDGTDLCVMAGVIADHAELQSRLPSLDSDKARRKITTLLHRNCKTVITEFTNLINRGESWIPAKINYIRCLLILKEAIDFFTECSTSPNFINLMRPEDQKNNSTEAKERPHLP